MYKNSEDYPFTQSLEANWQVIRQELEQLGRDDFLDWPEKHLYGKGWQTFGLYAFGMKLGKNCKLCPETTKLVEQIPNMVTAGFSSLVPGTHISPHTGYPDGVLRCHLGLIGCDGCSLRVGDEIRNWQEGKCLVFDDTTEHEAWNRGEQTRVVLLIDFKIDDRQSKSDASQSSKTGFWQKLNPFHKQ
ncbi:aspartyl/asparaginyl beta-hydroxylase domain-containing protein [Pseudanabaena mucicola]|uniref:Aspartyl/asparaginyl beta-hydroxylase domain-containing protein n=1 Tax=Pseudanabaena mucicola FACHB-723 TaxID=2692860 RepID=A0ABR7ZWN7_9CYAN|nr:aspartyl/asparaginyl beta-hydroxylase domain-containing protein [Pseudanabaena mucicola]MBD2188376.1 aspartyl/asparaginyl beta-hydroxylase domain-containing protein [Pseudanabaena mucicola FACHB-723]